MKQLTVISGKGGTGKTTVTAAFAHLAHSAVIADCDVDAADLHLILEPSVRHQEKFVGSMSASIHSALCTQCGECRRMCRFEAIGSDLVVDPVACEGCGVCAAVCPVGAAEMKDRVSGEWFISDTREGVMMHARLGIAEDNSGKLVSLVRQQAKKIAEEEKRDLVLIDGPPGIGCPVIAAISGVDMVLIVTEPTLSGLHDMQRVLDTAAHFNVPGAVCINKYDINPDNTRTIENACRERGVPLVGSIPYDKRVTEAMIRRLSVVERDCGAVSDQVRSAWEHVCSTLENRDAAAKDS